jgi:hypothetical protein
MFLKVLQLLVDIVYHVLFRIMGELFFVTSSYPDYFAKILHHMGFYPECANHHSKNEIKNE